MSTAIGRGSGGAPWGAPDRPAADRGRKPQMEQDGGAALTVQHAFTKFASATAHATGTPWAFLVALGVILVWGLTGPIFHFSDTWQLVINTGTTIVTFLMVFLIQHTQNRDAKALHIKLDELLRAVAEARNDIIDIEEEPDEEIEAERQTYAKLSKQAPPTGTPDVS